MGGTFFMVKNLHILCHYFNIYVKIKMYLYQLT
jgi:hypothetical protein